MEPLVITNESSEFPPFLLAALEGCSEESVYAPGYIQPHGVLLTLQESDLKILQVSENVEDFLGISARALVGQPLQQLFSRSQVKRIAGLLQHPSEFCNPFKLKTRRGITQPNQGQKSQTFRSTLYKTAGALILELEPLQTVKENQILQTYFQLQTVILKLRDADSFLDLAQVLAQEVKTIIGFDRVMIYRFEADDHGVVIAEEKEAHLESYLGLHYPAIDIPAPARKLFLRNWVRQIPDINYTPAPLYPLYNPLTNTPLDLSACVLRGVSPYHVEYLQNMGVAGSFTISLIDDQRLWGLIACHHYSPRLVNYEIRKTCEFIGQFASIELVHQQNRELACYQTQVRAIQDKLQQAFLREPNFIQQVLTRHAADLLDLVHADGLAIALDQQITVVGKTPPLEAVRSLLSWLPTLHEHEIYLTQCLSRPYPTARAFKDTASGILAISIVLHQRSYYLIWFRPEQIQTVNWAGKLQGTITVDELGNLRLCPRKSFELWKETVQETSLPWQSAEIEAALMMRNTLMLAVLEFSQAALEQAAERAAIANRAKSQFLAKMSHELRTPLNAILGFAQLMNRSPYVPTEFQEPLDIINRSGEHLLTLINDVLEMSRIEAGQLLLNESCFDLFKLVRSIREMFALKASEKGIQLHLRQDPTVPNYVCGDEAKLRQILINLLSNAIKFTQDGEVTLSVSAMPEPLPSLARNPSSSHNEAISKGKQPVKIQFAVEDTGCGIAASELESIFEAFMQAERGRHVAGTGLGLSISRQFARLMDGDITVKSTLNQGSTFTCQITLDLPGDIDLVTSQNSRKVIGLEPGQRTYRILVAEDVPENQQLMVTLLGSIGFEVRTAQNGAEAIAQWQTWQPHLILMDIEMPVVDGYEATRQIRAQEAYQQQSTPIIALTAYAFADDRTASLQAGCNAHIAKPFTEAALFEAIAQHLGVHYCYVEQAQEPFVSATKMLTAQDLQVMPTDWIAQVHEAALDLNDSKICQLITEIPSQEASLIAGMSCLVDNFQLETIAILTQF
ncbi:MAG: hypothetical protein Kow00121_22020 [Elainellaceae cyanobacterium]